MPVPNVTTGDPITEAWGDSVADSVNDLEAVAPTTDEKAALAGTSGAPATGNKYVTDADPRNTNSRSPSDHTHAASGGGGGGALAPASLILPGAVGPTPTTEGQAQWDTAQSYIVVGTGAGTAYFFQAAGTPSTQDYGDAPAAGSASSTARSDHKHGMPAAPAAPTINVYTSNDTWTKPAGARYIDVEVVGGGGGGGGGGATGASTRSDGGGGGGGGYSRKTYAAADLDATEAVVVGAAGSAGANTGGNGGSGGTSSFADGADLIQATGGAGGSGMAASSSVQTQPGGAGGLGSGGQVNVKGEGGAVGQMSGNGAHFSGNGGSTVLGGGGAAPIGGGGAGGAGGQYGGGGAGASVGVSSGGALGGAGAAGVVIVRTYF